MPNLRAGELQFPVVRFRSAGTASAGTVRVFLRLFFTGTHPLDKIKNYQTNPFAKNQNACKQRVYSPSPIIRPKKRTHFPAPPPGLPETQYSKHILDPGTLAFLRSRDFSGAFSTNPYRFGRSVT